MAKIEKHEALEHIDDILLVADGIMVARGDLGVEIPLEEVPMAQKDLIHRANKVSKPVVTATQMLESMISSPRPTRAEATDVANAILDGTDAVMLSGETARGAYPLEAVRVMATIALQVESKYPFKEIRRRRSTDYGGIETDEDIGMSIAEAAVGAADALGLRLIVTGTTTGNTARHISSFRPRARIVALTPLEEVARRMAVVWGVESSVVQTYRYIETLIEIAEARVDRRRPRRARRNDRDHQRHAGRRRRHQRPQDPPPAGALTAGGRPPAGQAPSRRPGRSTHAFVGAGPRATTPNRERQAGRGDGDRQRRRRAAPGGPRHLRGSGSHGGRARRRLVGQRQQQRVRSRRIRLAPRRAAARARPARHGSARTRPRRRARSARRCRAAAGRRGTCGSAMHGVRLERQDPSSTTSSIGSTIGERSPARPSRMRADDRRRQRGQRGERRRREALARACRAHTEAQRCGAVRSRAVRPSPPVTAAARVEQTRCAAAARASRTSRAIRPTVSNERPRTGGTPTSRDAPIRSGLKPMTPR